MIYELREYVAFDGKVDELHLRFRDAVFQLFLKHGIEVSGFWTKDENPNTIVYLCRFENKDTRKAAWQAFMEDPEWQRVKRESEANGQLIKHKSSELLREVPYFQKQS